MTDEELIAHLRLQGLDKDVAAADRIEHLIEARNTMGNLWANEKEAKHNAEAKLAKAVEALKFTYSTLTEINPSNYDHDQVCEQNSASVEAILSIAAVLGELEKSE